MLELQPVYCALKRLLSVNIMAVMFVFSNCVFFCCVVSVVTPFSGLIKANW